VDRSNDSCVTSCRVLFIAAQTEGDTGYDYNDAYEDSYDESSGQIVTVQFTK